MFWVKKRLTPFPTLNPPTCNLSLCLPKPQPRQTPGAGCNFFLKKISSQLPPFAAMPELLPSFQLGNACGLSTTNNSGQWAFSKRFVLFCAKFKHLLPPLFASLGSFPQFLPPSRFSIACNVRMGTGWEDPLGPSQLLNAFVRVQKTTKKPVTYDYEEVFGPTISKGRGQSRHENQDRKPESTLRREPAGRVMCEATLLYTSGVSKQHPQRLFSLESYWCPSNTPPCNPGAWMLQNVLLGLRGIRIFCFFCGGVKADGVFPQSMLNALGGEPEVQHAQIGLQLRCAPTLFTTPSMMPDELLHPRTFS